ncbi:MAG: hypothetical protein MUQ26_06575, partial [Armatimonadetes bacterium]|nr:hypothetical protein [Armatimonadota bacterium]
LGSRVFDDRHAVIGMYTAENWRAYRTWGVSANSPWEHGHYWRPREGVSRERRELKVDWDGLQRPGFSADYIDEQYERMDLAFARSDWEPTADALALIRNNMPLLAYIGGKPARFTSKDHNFHPGEMVEKQLIIINNSREAVTCEWEWSFGLPEAVTGSGTARVPTGDQARIPIRFTLPPTLAPGTYELTATVSFSTTGESQTDTFAVHVMGRRTGRPASASIALFDPEGETAALLNGMGIRCQPVDADADLSAYEMLIIGKGGLTLDGAGPDLGRVRQGLKVIVFEQTADVLEKRLGFRVAEYGLRQVFGRVADHPVWRGIASENLRDWRGEATLLPPRLEYKTDPEIFNGAPTVKWCDIDVTRVWRCGCRGSVASVLIEKPARGDFLPLADGAFGLQYSPLMECREGSGVILFCQMDVTGRTEGDPAAEALTRNILQYAEAWEAPAEREPLYVGDPAGRRYLERAGLALGSYEGGEPAADQVLIVGPGRAPQVAGDRASIGA